MKDYNKGSTVLVRDIIFADGERDPKHLRPAMLTITTNWESGQIYCLAITSKVGKYLIDPDRYYLVDEDLQEKAQLVFPSLVKLDKVHKLNYHGEVKGGFPPQAYKEIIEKLKQYMQREDVYDPYYEEIKDFL